MPDQFVDNVIDQAQSQTIQARGRGEVEARGIPIVLYLATGGTTLPPWWSAARDVALRSFWKDADHLSSALYNMVSKMEAIPFSVISTDLSNKAWVEEAKLYTDRLLYGAEYGDGWQLFYSRFLEDMLGQDNGAFAEVIGAGDPTGPLIGSPITISHLDAGQCRRTGDPEYPVVYVDTDGKLYKLHRSRVMSTSQMPSSKVDMYGVGFCAISRCINVAQNLLDILTYKQEKLGSRPHRFIMITQGGLDPEDIRSAFSLAEIEMSTTGLSRYSKGVVVGNQANPDSDAKIIELASLPDGFDEQTSVTLGMATVAMAFGVDARELFPAMSAGATRADALLQHIKQRGKGPGQIIQAVQNLFNHKFLPPYLRLIFDFQDDAEDRQIAEIRHIRSQKRERDIADGAINTRTAREQMVADGEITREQFERMELQDGRLEDGTSIFSMFFSDDPLLKFPELVQNPLDTINNDPTYMISEIADLLSTAYEEWNKVKGNRIKEWEVNKSIAALNNLNDLYLETLATSSMMNEAPQDSEENGEGDGDSQGVESSRMFPTRREDLLNPNQKVELDNRDTLRPGKDDKSRVTERAVKLYQR